MMFLVLDIQSTAHLDNCSRLQAWVNVSNHQDAISVLTDELTEMGWVVTDIVETTQTQETDYFAPCQSLDAFNEARKGLLALRFAEDVKAT